MPVASETSRIQYVGNGTTVTPYSVPFYFLANADIRVVLTDVEGAETLLVESTHYTLTGAGSPLGGSLTTAVAHDSTHTLTIYREPQQTQSADFQSTGALPADTLTRGLDKLTMLVQSLARKLGRCFRLNDKAGDVAALSEATRANTVFGFDAAGIPSLRDRTSLLSLLSLSGSVQGAPTAYWEDDGERALKVPDFVGQLGLQLDSSAVYRSIDMGAGDWAGVSMTGMAGNIALSNIANTLITYAKLQNVSATQRVLGRNSSGDGSAEEVTLSQLLDWVGGASHGDVLYRGASAWQRLPAGSAGRSLLTGGAGANPTWGAGTVVHMTRVRDVGAYSTTASIPSDNTVPQISEGTQFFTTAYTPKLATSTIYLRMSGWCSGNQGMDLIFAVFLDGGTDAIGATTVTIPGANYRFTFDLPFQITNTTSAAKTITARFGTNAGVAIINSTAVTQLFLTTDGITLEIIEVAP